VMTTVHSDPKLDYMGSPLRKYTFGVINGWALRRMDYYVAVAWRMRELLIDRGFEAQNIFTVYNGLDFSGASEEPRPFKDGSEPIVVGIAARLNPVKDIPTLMRAFAKARQKDGRLRLSIAGTGEEEASLKKLAAELGIENDTVFEGWISDIKAYFSRVDINVLSSLSETFPYSLLEGAYEHCPAIASNVGGIPYLIQNEKTGLLFEAGDADAFASCILRLAGDPALRAQLAEALYEKARSEFSLERMKTDQEAIYRTLIHRSEMQKRGRYGAVLCGAYGKGNAGDDAILRAILTSLKAIDPDMPFYVMSRNPVETSMKERVGSFYIFNLRKFFKYLHKTSLFVSGGGTLIQDVTSSRSLYFYLFTLLAAKWSGSRVVMYGCGIGPIRKGTNRRWTGRVLNRAADIITLRDSISMELLQEIGVTRPEIILSADPTVNLPPVPDETVQEAFRLDGIPADAKKIAFCLRSWDEFRSPEAVAKAADYAYERYGLLPVFLPMEYPRDVAIGELVGGMVNVPHAVCSRRHTVEELRGMLSSMEVVCGMRLHSLIFASAGGSPIVGISYDVKVDSFIKDSGARRCIQLKDLTAEALMADIDDAVAGGRSRGSETKRRLQTMELKNGEAAQRLLSGKESA
ncbi:MAG: polysaccharide pyruvyl transferase CsaB, partial [Firmicutes bacterium]|nr:polysaccharide pyruvyl transferase CsaB [Bacillota bacterium]